MIIVFHTCFTWGSSPQCDGRQRSTLRGPHPRKARAHEAS